MLTTLLILAAVAFAAAVYGAKNPDKVMALKVRVDAGKKKAVELYKFAKSYFTAKK